MEGEEEQGRPANRRRQKGKGEECGSQEGEKKGASGEKKKGGGKNESANRTRGINIIPLSVIFQNEGKVPSTLRKEKEKRTDHFRREKGIRIHLVEGKKREACHASLGGEDLAWG